jgi:hypothetical protein
VVHSGAVKKGGTVRTRHIVLAVLAATAILTSLAAAGPDAAKQRISITSKGFGTPAGQFVFIPLQAGMLKRDSGTENSSFTRRAAVREGLSVEVENAMTTSDGKRGRFVIRHRVEWVDVGGGYQVGLGTWTFVRGTGQYAQMIGRGRSAWLFPGSTGAWRGRVEGFLVVRK